MRCLPEPHSFISNFCKEKLPFLVPRIERTNASLPVMLDSSVVGGRKRLTLAHPAIQHNSSSQKYESGRTCSRSPTACRNSNQNMSSANPVPRNELGWNTLPYPESTSWEDPTFLENHSWLFPGLQAPVGFPFPDMNNVPQRVSPCRESGCRLVAIRVGHWCSEDHLGCGEINETFGLHHAFNHAVD